MKAQLFVLSAAALTLGAAVSNPVAAAGSTFVQRFVADADAAAETRLTAEGVDLAGRTLIVKASVGSDRRLSSFQVLQSTGSRNLDDAAAKVLRNLRVTTPPVELLGRNITLTLGDGAPHTTVAAR